MVRTTTWLGDFPCFCLHSIQKPPKRIKTQNKTCMLCPYLRRFQDGGWGFLDFVVGTTQNYHFSLTAPLRDRHWAILSDRHIQNDIVNCRGWSVPLIIIISPFSVAVVSSLLLPYIMWFDVSKLLQNLDMPNLIQLTTIYLIPLLLTIGMPLSLKQVNIYWPKLARDPATPKPTMPCFFMTSLAAHIVTCMAFILQNVNFSEFRPTTVALFLSFVTIYFLMCTAVFMIGLATAHINATVNEISTMDKIFTTQNQVDLILSEFRAVKALLSPVLFITVVSSTMLAISFSYRFLTHRDMQFCFGLINALTSLLYVSFAVDNCCQQFKLVPEKLWYDRKMGFHWKKGTYWSLWFILTFSFVLIFLKDIFWLI